MAIDTAHHRLFSGCRSGVMAVSDYQAGKVVATVPIGTGVDGAGFDASSGDAFASNADGTLTVIHQDTPDQYRRHPNAADGARVAQYGTGPGDASRVHRLGEIWTGAGNRKGPSACPSRFVHAVGRRARSNRPLILSVGPARIEIPG